MRGFVAVFLAAVLFAAFSWAVYAAELDEASAHSMVSGGAVGGGIGRIVYRFWLLVEERFGAGLIALVALAFPRAAFKTIETVFDAMIIDFTASRLWDAMTAPLLRIGIVRRTKNSIHLDERLSHAAHFAFSILVLGTVFAFLLRPEWMGLGDALIMGTMTAAIAMGVHKAGHQFIAKSYGHSIRYSMSGTGTAIFILVATVMHDLFISQGNIAPNPKLGRAANAKIALGGALANVLAFSAACYLLTMGGIIAVFGQFFAIANLAYATDNMFPTEPGEGHTVFKYSKAVWAATAIPLWIVGFGFVFAML